jgi:excinuclease ABC subunit C
VKQLEDFNIFISNCPNKPGVYKFLDKNNNVLYVGKAKNLKKRLSSYFVNDKNKSAKLNILLKKLNKIEYIVTKTENDAFLLENNLIKSLQPKYNVLLKDDKTYPWIKITNEEFPRIIKTRIYTDDKSKYYGPYSSLSILYTLLELSQKLFNIRTCKLNLTDENIKKNKYKPCLEYHIGNCKAPCIGKVSKDEYKKMINFAEKILKGEIKTVKEYLYNKMHEHASKLEFEIANEYKQKLNKIEEYQAKSVVVNPKFKDIDVFAFKRKEKYFFINYLKINNGSIIQSHNLILEPQLEESDYDLLILGIKHIRETFKSEAKNIICPIEITNIPGEKVNIINPKSGDFYKLLQMANYNVNEYAHHYIMNKLKADYGNVNTQLLEKVKNDLLLKELPVRIECFDISHHAGEFIVASCVVFINGKPSKKDYRHFKIKSIDFPDDFSAMREVTYRRYYRLLTEKAPLPHLIIIDGGKGQLSAALSSLKELDLNNKIEIISIAKKLEDIYKPDDNLPLYINKNSETLKLIQRIRDEAHRFAITFHRHIKLNKSFTSVLDEIKGIGEKTKKKLINNYQSIEEISKADLESLESIIGKHKAKIIWKYFHNEP